MLRKFVYHFAAAPKKLTSKTVAQHIVNKIVLDFFEVSHISQISKILLLFAVPCLIRQSDFLSLYVYDNHYFHIFYGLNLLQWSCIAFLWCQVQMICLFLLVPEKPGFMEKFTPRSVIPELIDMSSSNR